MKTIRVIIIFGLVSGVCYLGLKYWQPPAGTPMPGSMVEDIGELRTLHEEMAVFEQKIRDLQKEGQPYAEEELAAEELKIRIQNLKSRIAGNLPPEALQAGKTAPQSAGERLFGDKYQRVLTGALGGLLCLLILIFLFGRRRNRPAAPSSPVPAPAEIPPQPDLKETLEKFKSSLMPVMKKGETGELSLDGLKESLQKTAQIPGSAVPLEERKEKADAPGLSAPPEGSGDNGDAGAPPEAGPGAVEEVFELSMRGLSVEEISEKLRLDKDKVRLILRFRQ